MPAHDIDVREAIGQAQFVDASRSTFTEIHPNGQQINGNHITINQNSRNSDKERHELSDWLTLLNFRQKQNDTYGNKQEGTGDWVFDNERFKEWERGDVKTLWCPGIPGAGKTVIASHIINHLVNTLKSPSVAVAYIYCDYKDQSSQTVFDLVASLLKQLVQDFWPTFERVESRYQSHRQQKFRPTLKEIHDTLISEIKAFSQVFIIVDALDEIAEERKKRYEILHRLQSLGCNLLVTSRDIESIGKDLRGAQCVYIRASDDDIRQYIECAILGTPLEEFVAEEPRLKEEVVDCVTKYADGMCVLLQFILLKAAIQCWKEVRDALINLSKEVNSAYDETMIRINKLDGKLRELAFTAIMCITYALRPLRDKELQQAVTLLRGGLGISSNDLVNITTIVGACAGLVVIDAERSVARLIHYTAQEYFSGYKKWLCSNPHAELTNILLKVLSLPPPADTNIWWPFSGELSRYAVENWGNHARGIVEETNKAIIHEFLHCKQNIERLRSTNLTGGSHSSVMHICAYWGLTRTIEYQLQNGAVVIQRDDDTGRTALHMAAGMNHVEVVRLLLARGHDVNSQGNEAVTPLFYAANAGNTEVVTLLLSIDDIKADSKDEEGRTPLSLAAQNGIKEIASLLLERDDVEADSKTRWGQTPLSIAAQYGNEEVVCRLKS
ncbi:hypothetical protein SERLA73DRAFT_80187 [Serpula lacrymans var. lacrymans S7.3]|uniref:Nephrocystin 3-like N-terminal domain-containing protein n=1 Tax=Serpula lacrymans var. lacrymans (strain S7.3) TaxID=936435 RepID=F8QIZ9_SERL3|nr:hypothetical protein SERLA73DRAFT_80187 [Serpula lacrymans var. lacrymans S7.3]